MQILYLLRVSFKMNKRIGIVPLRSKSKRIENKNIKPFLGKPLFWWVCTALENSKVDEFIISTDSKDYIEEIQRFHFTKVSFHLRSDKNSSDHATTENVIEEIVNERNESSEDLIVLVQATSPWVVSKDINNVIDIYTEIHYNSILSTALSNKFIWDSSGLPINYDYESRPRSQDFLNYHYIENGGIYLISFGGFRKEKNRLLKPIGIYEMPYWTSLEIDEEEDWVLLESIMKTKGYIDGD